MSLRSFKLTKSELNIHILVQIRARHCQTKKYANFEQTVRLNPCKDINIVFFVIIFSTYILARVFTYFIV